MLAVRASRRPQKVSTKRRATSVESRRSRAESSPATRATWALTPLSCASHGYGVTWAIAKAEHIDRSIIAPRGALAGCRKRLPARASPGGALCGRGRGARAASGARARAGPPAPAVCRDELLRVGPRLIVWALVARRLHQI